MAVGKRVFKIDIQTCHCDGTLTIIFCIDDPEVIARTLEHLDRSTSPAVSDQPPRAPPQGDLL